MSDALEIGGLWTVTRSAEEIAAEREAERKHAEELEAGLARCSVCGEAAKVVEFGLEGNGVWIGCDRSEECSRYIEMHEGGWSIEEAAAEWNRYNTGMYLVARRMKRWMRERFGAERRAERAREKQKRAKEAAERAKRREVFGIKAEERGGILTRILARRQKVDGDGAVGKEK